MTYKNKSTEHEEKSVVICSTECATPWSFKQTRKTFSVGFFFPRRLSKVNKKVFLERIEFSTEDTEKRRSSLFAQSWESLRPKASNSLKSQRDVIILKAGRVCLRRLLRFNKAWQHDSYVTQPEMYSAHGKIRSTFWLFLSSVYCKHSLYIFQIRRLIFTVSKALRWEVSTVKVFCPATISFCWIIEAQASFCQVSPFQTWRAILLPINVSFLSGQLGPATKHQLSPIGRISSPQLQPRPIRGQIGGKEKARCGNRSTPSRLCSLHPPRCFCQMAEMTPKSKAQLSATAVQDVMSRHPAEPIWHVLVFVSWEEASLLKESNEEPISDIRSWGGGCKPAGCSVRGGSSASSRCLWVEWRYLSSETDVGE